ncbi:MAG: biopolymer transporter ExbD [Pseudomonadales bacterium]|nr:biopolymer transporter ExbD [Pseudomonadales bacterium]
MKGFGKAKDEEQAGEIDLTPMLDVVFILLIFFIVTAVFVKEAGYDVLRPVAATSEPTTMEPILIAISPAGEIWMDGDIVLPRNVRLRIEQRVAESPNAGVVIQADQGAPNEFVLIVLNAAREAEVTNVQIAAEE